MGILNELRSKKCSLFTLKTCSFRGFAFVVSFCTGRCFGCCLGAAWFSFWSIGVAPLAPVARPFLAFLAGFLSTLTTGERLTSSRANAPSLSPSPAHRITFEFGGISRELVHGLGRFLLVNVPCQRRAFWS